jgi:hypothetical protein
MQRKCPKCGGKVAPKATFCIQCGYIQFNNPSKPKRFAIENGLIQMTPGTHQVALVIVVAFFFGGWLGSLLNQQVAKGILCWLVLHIVLVIVAAVIFSPFAFFVHITFYFLSLIDAAVIANRLNNGESVGLWQFF